MGPDPLSPCVIGVGRHTWRPGDDPGEPLDQWEHVARAAAADAGRPELVEHLDQLAVVHCMSWTYDDPPGRLAARLRCRPGRTETSILAGTAGQRMVNRVAEGLLAGHGELALVVGAEALATVRRLAKLGTTPDWSHRSALADEPPIDVDEWFWPTEWAHDVLQPSLTFAALDTARRARLGLDPGDAWSHEASVLDRLNAVAAANPEAWFRTRRDADAIATPTSDNRIISSPYTKYSVAVMDVDMAAGVLLATHGAADRLGIPRDRRVYLRGWSFARDAVHLAARPELHRSPAMAAAAADALARAGAGIDDVDLFDLYSCFASSLMFATDALGIDPLDERGLTVTGGLPYHGGPGSNSTTHAIVELVHRLRERDGLALLSGVGMHMCKHVWAVYGSAPGPVTPPDYGAVQRRVDAAGDLVPVVVDADDRGVIAAYSVTHGREGRPATALVIADLASGGRAYARTEDPDALVALGDGEWVGRPLRLRPDGRGRNLATLD